MSTQDPIQPPLCLLDESNDMEAFAALPDCGACEGTGKQLPAEFWTRPTVNVPRPLTAFVAGRPAPQGSKHGYATRTGKVAMVESSKAVKPWRADVRQALLDDHGNARARFDGPVRVRLEFVMPRPKSMPVTRPTPPHTKKPDVDKLARAVLDAISSAGVWPDDSYVVDLHPTKRTAERGEQHGCHITIEDAR